MNNSLQLMDCTLRDGGFINDWLFGTGTIRSIISRLDKAKIDVIEIGFINENRSCDLSRTILPSTEAFAPLLSDLQIDNAEIAVMIDYGTCSLENIQSKNQTCIDVIRIIFKKKDVENALEYCRAIKEKGYKISVQPVSVTSYNAEEFVELVRKINKIDPDVVSIVDTYGLMHNKETSLYFDLLNSELNKNVAIGFHAHNNFQMAYANCILLMNNNLGRRLVLDGSLYGMGKGAGNAPSELLAQYMNENYNHEYDINQLLEAIDVDILKEFSKNSWGYSLKYFIAASQDCHPSYVDYLISKKTLSVENICRILEMIPEDNKLSFNTKLIEELLATVQNNYINDTGYCNRLSEELKGQNIVVLAPGLSINENKKNILKFIEQNNAKVISINFLHEDFNVDYVFMGNPKRYSQFFHKIYTSKYTPKVICTSNITASTYPVDFYFDFDCLKLKEPQIRDNPMLMLVKLLQRVGINKLYVAGFDGYKIDANENYYNEYIPLLFCDADVLMRNDLIKQELKSMKEQIELRFITNSIYNK